MFAEADEVFEETIETPYQEHVHLETNSAIADMEDGKFVFYASAQCPFYIRKSIAGLLDIPYDDIIVRQCTTGGAFGGKEHFPDVLCGALLVAENKIRKPIKMVFDREEDTQFSVKRHPSKCIYKTAVKDGKITGVYGHIYYNCGAYLSSSYVVLQRGVFHGNGVYTFDNTYLKGEGIGTNMFPSCAFRGFGVTQTCFATETLLNEMADKVGITPWEIRYRNAIRPGEVLPNGQIVGAETGLVETLEAVKPYYDEAMKLGKPVGIACAMKNAGVGVGIPDWGRCKLIVEDDAKVHIYAGASCIGQGVGTVLVQMIVTNTPLTRGDIVYERSNTWIAPDSGDTSGSRQTLVTGEACRRACEKLAAALETHTLAELAGQEFYGEYLAKTDKLGADVPHPVSHVAYGYATQMCVVDKKTGKVESLVAAHDVGKAVNPRSCEGQIEGGVVMSMGYALREQYPIDENCKPIEKYGELGLFRAHEIPKIVPIVVDKPGLDVACGAIGIGEITSIPTAPAIADAYFRYDGERRTKLPLANTPYERRGK